MKRTFLSIGDPLSAINANEDPNALTSVIVAFEVHFFVLVSCTLTLSPTLNVAARGLATCSRAGCS